MSDTRIETVAEFLGILSAVAQSHGPKTEVQFVVRRIPGPVKKERNSRLCFLSYEVSSSKDGYVRFIFYIDG